MDKIIYFFILISFFWFIREIKAILFWLYLWQLKKYDLGCFLAHFQTEKGKKLFLNWLLFSKTILFFYALFFGFYLKSFHWFYYSFWVLILIFFYFVESVKFLLDSVKKQIKKPILTKKTLFLSFVSLIFETSFLFILFQKTRLFYWFSFFLLFFDILTPFFVSGIIFLFQPLTIYWRNQIIKKAKEKREKFKDLIVIGITGSYGKTSTKEFLATILAEKFGKDKVLKTKEHQNLEIAIAQTILNDLKPEHQIFIAEMGAYHRGEIKLRCDIAKPRIGIITGVNEQHLGIFGSMNDLLLAEGGKELIEALPEDGLIIFNGNNKYCREIYQEGKKRKKICYNTFPTAVENVLLYDLIAENVKVEKEFVSFKVLSKDGDMADFKANLLGAQNVENILLAACCAKELGMDLKEISQACEKLKPLPCQMELKRFRSFNTIDSTYSANPDGVLSHLEYLKIWPNKKIIVMPCLIELGPASKEVHQRIGQKIAEVCDLAIITTKERFKEIKEIAGDKVIFLENPKEIFEKIKDFYLPSEDLARESQEENVILLESRVPREVIKLLSEYDYCKILSIP